MVICLERGAIDLHMVHSVISCVVKILNGSAILVPVYPGCPGKKVVK